MSLFLDSNLLERLERHDPSDRLDQDNLADCWTALEGVSHFLCVAHNAGHDRPVSRLALEMQAEIDKYVASFALLCQVHPRRFPAELHALLFRRTRIDPALAAGRESLYRRASREAARFCARLEPGLRSFCGRDDGAWLAALRRFYRLSDFGKMRHIERNCAPVSMGAEAREPALLVIRPQFVAEITVTRQHRLDAALDLERVALKQVRIRTGGQRLCDIHLRAMAGQDRARQVRMLAANDLEQLTPSTPGSESSTSMMSGTLLSEL